MKRLVLFATSALLLWVVGLGFGQPKSWANAHTNLNSALVPPAFENSYPQLGMTIADLATAITEITPLLPTTPGAFDRFDSNYKPKVLSMTVHGTGRIVLTTGHQDGPRSGSGRMFEFRKLNGKWTKVAERDWVS